MSKLPTFFQGLRWTTTATAVSFGIGLLQTAILVRLLDKTDFAEIAIASVFINIGVQIQNGGINTALIQRAENASQALSSLFWLNQLFSILLFVLSISLAIFIGILYQNTTLTSVFVFYSLLFLINGLGVQQKAILQKYFQFKQLAGIEIIGVCCGFAVAILFAWYGWGSVALVLGYLARSAVETMVAWLWGWRYFIPSPHLNWQEIKFYTHFSSLLTAERIITHLVSQLDILLISKFLGLDSAGVYDLFKRTLLRPSVLLNVALERVLLPVFSAIKEDENALGKAYFKLLNVSMSIHFLVYLTTFILSPWLVSWYFGAGWTSYVAIFQALCIFAILYAFINPLESLLIALNKIHYQLLMYILIAPVLILAVLIGNKNGLNTTVNFIVLAYTIIYIFSFVFILRKWLVYILYSQILKSFGFALISFLLATIINYFSPIISVGVFVCCYIYLTFNWNTEVLRYLQQLIKQPQ